MGYTPTRPYCLAALLTGAITMSSLGLRADELIPTDTAYQASPAQPSSAASTTTSTEAIAPGAEQTAEPRHSQCANPNRLHKSLAITAFTRLSPHTSNAGNLYAAEQGFPQRVQALLADDGYLSPSVLAQGFGPASLTPAQRKRQAQDIARAQQAQFVVSGQITNMSMFAPDTTYNPSVVRAAANTLYDLSGFHGLDARTRVFAIDMELRDGFTGELLLQQHYQATGVWNKRRPMGFDAPAFWQTPYGKQVHRVAEAMRDDIAKAIECQPFMATIDARPGQVQVLLHGGANNGLRAGDSLRLYQLMVLGSNTHYQVSDTRLVKRDTQLHLNEVYPSHSIATIQGGRYLNGHYLAVSE